MYSKCMFFSINNEGGFNEGLLNNTYIKDEGLFIDASKRGSYYSFSFDSQENGTVWHMINIWSNKMDFEVYYYASDNKQCIKKNADKKIDIDKFMLDSSYEQDEKEKCLEEFWEKKKDVRKMSFTMSDDGYSGNMSSLFVDTAGRYLWIRIKVPEVMGDDIKDLIIKKIRLYYPRTSFLSYLPRVYQNDAESRDFLDRYLSIFGTIYDEFEEEIDNISKYFDPDAVEDEYLKWLSSWLAITSDDIWDKKRRELLKKAPEIYKIRGTKRAIEQMIELYTGERPKIVEYFEYKEFLKDPDQKDRLINLFGNDPYTFSVLISSECVKENHQKIAVRKILMEEKPGYTETRLILLKNSIELDGHTYLGINSIFMENSKLLLDPEQSVLYNNELRDE
ncbi:phage tail protein [Pseudobacteroides cellulosolvens]|uniref:Phage tail protein n=1 Tax=Pseudobacteroides cellulosolvens ATCC 35603 = DSM 2933 TaxID=398512 RepID=A0A0L6JHZ7_9FIRM|nr:phage tail protein [Pseudobacteroides cellulosolvens]KNY25330.1 phage tail protein [Pseudobacteroides cellulosolvens ATCC 35603 = DSM 2933]